MTSKEDLIYKAKVCEQTERFEDMIEAMRSVINSSNEEPTVEERNLLSVAYKNTVGSRRTAWRALSAIEQKEESKGGKHTPLLRSYKKTIEDELNKFCNEVLSLITDKILGTCVNAESKVFFHKMKGDYYRYMSEYASGEAHSKVSQEALGSYNSATTEAESLKKTNPIRLGLALNFSVFHYEVLNDPQKACSMAKTAFDDAIGEIEELGDDEYKDSTTIMQLIRDNLTLWSSELEEAEGDN